MTLESHLEQTVTSASNVSRICESTADPMLPLPPKDRIWNRRISTKGLGILPQDQMNVHVILNHWLILHIKSSRKWKKKPDIVLTPLQKWQLTKWWESQETFSSPTSRTRERRRKPTLHNQIQLFTPLDCLYHPFSELQSHSFWRVPHEENRLVVYWG